LGGNGSSGRGVVGIFCLENVRQNYGASNSENSFSGGNAGGNCGVITEKDYRKKYLNCLNTLQTLGFACGSFFEDIPPPPPPPKKSPLLFTLGLKKYGDIKRWAYYYK